MSKVTIFHNPACSNSRKALALIRDSGIEPTIVEYLKNPPSKQQLLEIVAAMGTGARSLLRSKETDYSRLKLGDPGWSDDELLDFLSQYPVLMNRPIVVTPLGTKLCRPPEIVLELLPRTGK